MSTETRKLGELSVGTTFRDQCGCIRRVVSISLDDGGTIRDSLVKWCDDSAIGVEQESIRTPNEIVYVDALEWALERVES